jgi:ankyrin repeat protein
VTPLLAARGTATPLLAAIESRNMEVINLLLSKDGIDVNFCPQSNMTPLLMAIRHGPMEVVESLFARDDVDLNVVDYDGNHVLLESMGLGLDKVKLILDRSNVDPNIVSPMGRTALMMACSMEKGDLDLIEFFLDQGIDINRQDANGMTAFCWAVNSGCSKVVKLLIDRDDMDPNLPDICGKTPLFYCISPFSSGLRRSSDMDIMDLLLRKEGIDVNARDISGSTALAFACALWPDRAFDYAGLLLSHGTDPNILDNNGVSALSKVIYGRTHICGTKAYSQNLQKLESLLRAAGAR